MNRNQDIGADRKKEKETPLMDILTSDFTRALRRKMADYDDKQSGKDYLMTPHEKAFVARAKKLNSHVTYDLDPLIEVDATTTIVRREKVFFDIDLLEDVDGTETTEKVPLEPEVEEPGTVEQESEEEEDTKVKKYYDFSEINKCLETERSYQLELLSRNARNRKLELESAKRRVVDDLYGKTKSSVKPKSAESVKLRRRAHKPMCSRILAATLPAGVFIHRNKEDGGQNKSNIPPYARRRSSLTR